jgi:hypothetical protein
VTELAVEDFEKFLIYPLGELVFSLKLKFFKRTLALTPAERGWFDHALDNLPPYRSKLVASAEQRGGRNFVLPNSTRVQPGRLLTEENDRLRCTLWPERIPAKRGIHLARPASSLSARSLKGQYLPLSWMEANMGSNPILCQFARRRLRSGDCVEKGRGERSIILHRDGGGSR